MGIDLWKTKLKWEKLKQSMHDDNCAMTNYEHEDCMVSYLFQLAVSVFNWQ